MLYTLSDHGLLKIQGTDAKTFLQGQLTCDVASLIPDNGCMGAHCNPKGRVISLFYLFLHQESYLLLLPRNMISIALTALKKYAVFFKVNLSDASSNLYPTGCINPDHELIKKYPCFQLPTDQSRYLIVADDTLVQHTQETSKKTDSIEAWKSLNIQDGIPAIYPETSSLFLPHEIHLDKLHAINFEKGCYTGQEIIARMHYRGKLKKHMVTATLTSDTYPTPGSSVCIKNEQEIKICGNIVDAVQKAYNKYQALIIMNEMNAQNNDLFLMNNEK